MQFDIYRMRKEGMLLPRHVMWSTRVRGELYIKEEFDQELSRHTRIATVKASDGKELIQPLLDACVVGAKPDWWTMTGWERIPSATSVTARACQQSWILVPTDKA